MKTFLIILVVLALIAAVYVYLIKKGKIKDDDQDYIPDVVEDKVSDIKETVEKTKKEVNRRARRVKEELDEKYINEVPRPSFWGGYEVDPTEIEFWQHRKGRSTSKAVIDHCHNTGKVRGILCHNCNVSLGLIKDNTQILLNMISYLKD